MDLQDEAEKYWLGIFEHGAELTPNIANVKVEINIETEDSKAPVEVERCKTEQNLETADDESQTGILHSRICSLVFLA